MNYTESFDQFATRIGPMDLALYAGAGLIIWVLFKDKLSPVQTFIIGFFNKKQPVVNESSQTVPSSTILDNLFSPPSKVVEKSDDVFFNLVASWKQTRDLAVKSGCVKAAEVADEMFPFLSPSVCSKKEVPNEQ